MFRFHELPGRGDAPSGDADMDMRMVIQLLSPGVQNGEDSGFCPEKSLVSTKSEKGFVDTFKKESQEFLLIRPDQFIEFMGHGEDDMKVGNPFNELGVAHQLPLSFQRSLTAGTGSVVAGNSVNNRSSTILADADVIPEFACLALHDRICGRNRLFWDWTMWAMSFQVFREKFPEGLPDRVRISRGHTDSSRSFRSRSRESDRPQWMRETCAPLPP